MGRRAWTVLALLAGSGWAGAHELGTVQVDAAFFKDGTYQIRALVDTEHLKTGLGPAADLQARLHPREPIAEPVAQRYGSFLRDYVSQTVVAFDWVQVEPQLSSVVLAPKPNPPPGDNKDYLTLLYSGEIPRGATKFVWSNATKLGTYLILLHQEGDEDVSRQFLEARQESDPFRLNPDVAPPSYLRILSMRWPHVAAALLGIGGLGWLALRRRRA